MGGQCFVVFQYNVLLIISADERGGESRYKLPGPGGPEGCPGPDYVLYFSSFSVVSAVVR